MTILRVPSSNAEWGSWLGAFIADNPTLPFLPGAGLPEDTWQDFAACLVESPRLGVLSVPDPSIYGDWKAWVDALSSVNTYT